MRARLFVTLVVLAALGPLATPALAQTVAATPPAPGALYTEGQTGRYQLGGEWLLRADPTDVGFAQGWQTSADTTGWSAVTVPNSFNKGDFSSGSQAGSVAWYRRDFTVPANAFSSYVPRSARRWILRFESVNYHADVWLNGRLLGSHDGAYLPFEFDVSGLHAGVNHLVVRVDSRRVATDLPPGPGGGWWNFGGLQREVYLRAVQEVDISRTVVRTTQSCPRCAASIDEQAFVRNPTGKPVKVTLTGRYGTLALRFGTHTIAPGTTWTADAVTTLAHPHLWSLTDPHLYRATFTLADAKGRRLGGYVALSGVRTIKTTADGRLTLNGHLLSLRGVNIHEQTLAEGAALSPASLRHLVDESRAVGATMIRAHYPLGPIIEEAADRDGVLLWSEIPVYQVKSANLAQPAVLANAQATLQANIFANENHPSVAIWSIGNELETPPPVAEATYIGTAARLAHRLDPTRPVGMAIASWPGVDCQRAYGPLDVIGFNDYFGWYDAGGGTTDDRDSLSPYLDFLRACYPTKALFVSEFGFEGNQDGPVEERGTYEFQSNAAAFHLAVFASKPYLSGALYFALQDFAVTPGWGGGDPFPDPPFLHKGLLDLSGNPKPAWAVVRAAFRAVRQVGPLAPSATSTRHKFSRKL